MTGQLRLRSNFGLYLVLLVQIACAIFFIYDILGAVVGLRTQPLNWRLRETVEIGAALGLGLGTVLGLIALRRSQKQALVAEEKLRLASGAFMDVLDENFGEWGLTPSERDVALFAVKGMSTHEIAEMRGVSEGTVKAQTNAIYRKAGVSGRPQLLSLFIEELLGDGIG